MPEKTSDRKRTVLLLAALGLTCLTIAFVVFRLSGPYRILDRLAGPGAEWEYRFNYVRLQPLDFRSTEAEMTGGSGLAWVRFERVLFENTIDWIHLTDTRIAWNGKPADALAHLRRNLAPGNAPFEALRLTGALISLGPSFAFRADLDARRNPAGAFEFSGTLADGENTLDVFGRFGWDSLENVLSFEGQPVEEPLTERILAASPGFPLLGTWINRAFGDQAVEGRIVFDPAWKPAGYVLLATGSATNRHLLPFISPDKPWRISVSLAGKPGEAARFQFEAGGEVERLYPAGEPARWDLSGRQQSNGPAEFRFIWHPARGETTRWVLEIEPPGPEGLSPFRVAHWSDEAVVAEGILRHPLDGEAWSIDRLEFGGNTWALTGLRPVTGTPDESFATLAVAAEGLDLGDRRYSSVLLGVDPGFRGTPAGILFRGTDDEGRLRAEKVLFEPGWWDVLRSRLEDELP